MKSRAQGPSEDHVRDFSKGSLYKHAANIRPTTWSMESPLARNAHWNESPPRLGAEIEIDEMRGERGNNLLFISGPPAPEKEGQPNTAKFKIRTDLERFVSMTDGMRRALPPLRPQP